MNIKKYAALFDKGSIAGSFAIAGAGLAAILLIFIAFAWKTVTDLQEATEHSDQVTMALRNHVESDMMHDALRSVVLASLLAGESGDAREVDQVRRDLQEYMDWTLKLQQATQRLDLGEETEAQLKMVQADFVSYMEQTSSIVAIALGSPAKARQRMPIFREQFDRMEESNEAFSDVLQQQALSAGKEIQTELKLLLIELVFGCVLIIGLAVLLVRYLRQNIADPLVRISNDLQSDEATDLSQDQARVDEIGKLARSVADFRKANERVAESEEARVEAQREAAEAEGKAAMERQRKEALTNTAEALEQRTLRIVNEVGATATKLKAVADALARAATKSREETTSATRSAENTLNGVVAIAQSTDELLVSINEVSTRIHDVARSGEEARTLAYDTEATINELNTMAGRIGSITVLIGEIAARTNLLALNAAIEASHAGAAGSGFAVVASEVKQLAHQTGQAVEEIDQQIAAMAAITKNATASLASVGGAIRELSGATSSIASATEQQGLATSEIGQTIERSSNETEAMRGNLARMDDQAEETARSAREVLDSTHSLEAQASQLSREISEFIAHAKAA